MLEAIRRTDELATFGELLPPYNAPLVLCSWIDAAAPNLADEEVLVAAALQTTAGSLGELLDQLALDKLSVCRTVVAMRERGLILVGNGQAVELGVNGTGPSSVTTG